MRVVEEGSREYICRRESEAGFEVILALEGLACLMRGGCVVVVSQSFCFEDEGYMNSWAWEGEDRYVSVLGI